MEHLLYGGNTRSPVQGLGWRVSRAPEVHSSIVLRLGGRADRVATRQAYSRDEYGLIGGTLRQDLTDSLFFGEGTLWRKGPVRDRDMLSVRLQVALRLSESIRLKVRGLLNTRGCNALRMTRKGGKQNIIAIHPESGQRIHAHLQVAGRADDRHGLFFHAMSGGRDPQPIRRQLYPDHIDWVLQKHVKQLGLGNGYSAHSMRATFITIASENGAKLEIVHDMRSFSFDLKSDSGLFHRTSADCSSHCI